MVRVMIGTGAGVAGVKRRIGSAAYKCKTCGMTFDSKKELQAHKKKTHGGKK